MRVCVLFSFGKVPQGESIDSAVEVSADGCAELCASVCVCVCLAAVYKHLQADGDKVSNQTGETSQAKKKKKKRGGRRVGGKSP